MTTEIERLKFSPRPQNPLLINIEGEVAKLSGFGFNPAKHYGRLADCFRCGIRPIAITCGKRCMMAKTVFIGNADGMTGKLVGMLDVGSQPDGGLMTFVPEINRRHSEMMCQYLLTVTPRRMAA